MSSKFSRTLKDKNFWYVILCFVPAVIILAVETQGFRRDLLTYGDIVLPTIFLIIFLRFVWYRYVNKPTEDFLHTINRAISGDYRARFSCYDEDQNFLKLSHSFNQFMSCVENQTDELTKNRQLQTLLYENEKIYRSALELTCERVFEADLTHNRLLYGQEIYCRAFPFLKTEMFDDTVNSIAKNAVCDDDVEKFKQTFSRQNLMRLLRKSGTTEAALEYRQKAADGKTCWVSATIILLNNSQKENIKVIGYVKNINERKQKDLEILKQSQKDGLTGLYNKKVTQSLIEDYFNGEGRDGRHAVIMVDIDNFKRINDTLGHIQGDVALMKVAQKLQSLFRSSDIVGRIGGDEFFVLLKNYISPEMLISKLQNVGKIFNDIRLEDETYRISGSIGVSLYPEDGLSYEELYKKSDIALYYSKEHGKNQFYFCGGRFAEKYRLPTKPQADPINNMLISIDNMLER